MPSTALLAIDSEDRFVDYTAARITYPNQYTQQNLSPYNFTINKNESLMNGFFTRLSVSEVVFPLTIPNINRKTYEIQFIFQQLGQPVNISILHLNPGFRSPSQIAEEIQAIVRAIAPAEGGPAYLPAFVMTYGQVPSPGQPIAPAMPLFGYGSGDPTWGVAFAPLPYNTQGYNFPSNTKQLFDLLGFNNGNVAPIVTIDGDPVIISTNYGGPTFAQAIRYVDIVCPQLVGMSPLKDTMSQTVARDSLCRIYINQPGTDQSTIQPDDPLFCPPGCAPMTIYRNFSGIQKQISWLPNTPVAGQLTFQVYDDAGALLSDSDTFLAVGNQNNWSMTLLVSEN